MSTYIHDYGMGGETIGTPRLHTIVPALKSLISIANKPTGPGLKRSGGTQAKGSRASGRNGQLPVPVHSVCVCVCVYVCVCVCVCVYLSRILHHGIYILMCTSERVNE